MTRTEKCMVCFTGIIAVATLVYVAIAYYQFGVMSDQLKEMRDGSKDTRAIAMAAQQQADNTKILAEAAKNQATAAIEQVNQLQASVGASNRIADTSQRSLRFAQQTFVKEQRPLVWISKTGDLNLTVGQRAMLNIYLANYGKSPAIGLRHRGQITFGKDAQNVDETVFRRMSIAEKKATEGTILIPGADDTGSWFTARSKAVLTKTDIEYIKKTDRGLAIFAYLEYSDASGNQWCSDICWVRYATGVIAKCEERNKIYECKQP